MEPTSEMVGAFWGLKLYITKFDIIRATKEGIAMNLKLTLDLLKEYTKVYSPMLMVGGSVKSDSWMQIFTDVYGVDIVKTSIDQETASIGTAALAFKALGLWIDYNPIDNIHKLYHRYTPFSEVCKYKKIQERFEAIVGYISELSEE